MTYSTRRQFIAYSGVAIGQFYLGSGSDITSDITALCTMSCSFPTEARQRIAIASWPFRDVILARGEQPSVTAASKMPLKDFARHVVAKFNINKIEPWNSHFLSCDDRYLDEIRTAFSSAGAEIVNIAVDGHHSPYSHDIEEREAALQFGKRWIDVAVQVGSPSVRVRVPPAKSAQPDAHRAAATVGQLAEYALLKKVIVNLENDNPVSEDPLFLVEVIELVNKQSLRALPDFGNSLARRDERYAYAGLAAMFQKAYNICHVKAEEAGGDGQIYRVDMAKTFGILKSAGFKGYCSMEFNSEGDPYSGTAELIHTTIKYLS